MPDAGDVPLNRIDALRIVDDLFAAIEVLSRNADVGEESAKRLIRCADEILDHLYAMGGGVWLHRTDVVAFAWVVLDHGYIPIYEQTLHQPLALDLLAHHDYLLGLLGEWP